MILGLFLLMGNIGFSTLSLSTGDITQVSTGWCSPNIVTTGNVSVTCIGVDPRALAVLNAELHKKNLDRSEAVREANTWAKRYKDLESQLSDANTDVVLSRKAESYLHKGDLVRAGATLDIIIKREEKTVDLTARNEFARALIYELQFKPVEALPHFQLAYQYRPESGQYGVAYANALLNAGDYSGAEQILYKILQQEKGPHGADGREIIETSSLLANACVQTQKFGEAEELYVQATVLARQLAQSDNIQDRAELAGLLRNLAELYHRENRLPEAIEKAQESLSISQQLSVLNPAYEKDVASTDDNLGIYYMAAGRTKDAEKAYLSALNVQRRLVKDSPEALLPGLQKTLNNLGLLYSAMGWPEQAIAALTESLTIRRNLAASNPGYRKSVAVALTNLGAVYSQTYQLDKARSCLSEALNTYRQLAIAEPEAYKAPIADVLLNQGILEQNLGDIKEAEKDLSSSLAMRQELAMGNPMAYREAVAIVEIALSNLYESTQQWDKAETYYENAIKLSPALESKYPRPKARMH